VVAEPHAPVAGCGDPNTGQERQEQEAVTESQPQVGSVIRSTL
jgi:hypothetical protein